ncbi:ABC-three component system protein [Streptomyces tirandamycinicus]|uniref:ABC-three component system protein n=1 Tax=Streptomyces tirandamycinicus TaxID=2174846 RepID=UPI0034129A66
MFRSLSSDLPEFKTASFRPGLNIVVAERTKTARRQDSRNAVGKTSLIRVLDFLLGADARPDHILRRPELEQASFELQLELLGRKVNVRRTGSDPSNVEVDGVTFKNTAWRQQLAKGLFALAGKSGEPSFRSLIAFYLRDVQNGAFDNATEVHRKQSAAASQSSLAYLFGLDLSLLEQAKEVTTAEKSLRDLRRAAKDPVLGMTLGKAQDLDAQIRTLGIQVSNLEQEIGEFKVVDQYAQHRVRADELSRIIRKLNDSLVMDERRLGDIELAINQEDQSQPDHSYVQEMYDQLQITLPGSVIRRFDEVAAFHRSVVENRRRYLQGERAALLDSLDEKRRELQQVDTERSEVMRILDAGGALETYKELQLELVRVRSRMNELQQRRETVDKWENANRHLQLRSAEMELRFSMDLNDRRAQIDEIAQLYSSYAYEIYGSGRPASLSVEASKTGYHFVPTIGGDRSKGVKSMALFCFDLTMAITARRYGRGPDFLVHDSHLYSDVEGRQMASALTLAAEVAEREGVQYVVTLNSDDLKKAQDEGFRVDFHECVRLTDAYETGGLFGIRFH